MAPQDLAADSLADKLKDRLMQSIAVQIREIGYVPDDLKRYVGGVDLDTAAWGAVETADFTDNARISPYVDKDALARAVNTHYDSLFYNQAGIIGQAAGQTEFRNLGYWDGATNQHEASVRLQDELLAMIPEKTGRILDAACGMGASTARLLEHYAPENVWAINISEKQIESTRSNAPGANAQVMNAVDLAFEDDFFDAIECIEAAFHFETRRRFLEEARRVLKPGGTVVLSDVLMTSAARLEQYDVFPSAGNHIATIED